MKKYHNNPDEIVDGQTVRRAFSGSIIKSIDAEKRQIEFIISTACVDRYGDIVEVNGWDLKNYKANPVVLFGHNSSIPPIGKALKTWKDGEALRSIAEFMSAELSSFANSIFRMYQEKFLRAVSVGFRPLKWERIVDEEGNETWSYRFKKQELLEFSAVPIPANPEALTAARSKGIDTAPFKSWAEEMLDNWKVQEPEIKNLYNLDRKGVEMIRRRAAGAGATFKVPLDLQDKIRSRNLEAIRAAKALKDKTTILGGFTIRGIDFELPGMKAEKDTGTIQITQHTAENGDITYTVDKADEKVEFTLDLLNEKDVPMEVELRDAEGGKQDLILTVKSANKVLEYDLVGLSANDTVFGVKINEEEVPVDKKGLAEDMADAEVVDLTGEDEEEKSDESEAEVKAKGDDEDEDEKDKADDSDDDDDDEEDKADDDDDDDEEDKAEGDDDDDDDDDDEKAFNGITLKSSDDQISVGALLQACETILCEFEDNFDKKGGQLTRHEERKKLFLAGYLRELADKLDGGKTVAAASQKKVDAKVEEGKELTQDEARDYMKELAGAIAPTLERLISDKVNKLKGRLD